MKRNEGELFEDFKIRRKEENDRIDAYLEGKLTKVMGEYRPKKPVIPVLRFNDPVILGEHRKLRKIKNKVAYKSMRFNRKKG